MWRAFLDYGAKVFFVILGVQAWTLLECGVGGLESAFSSENLENLDT